MSNHNKLEQVILVSPQDQAIGKTEKIKAHRLGQLHRAFSIFIFSEQIGTKKQEQKLLLQKRHPHKYHSGGLWSNTCCSHPHPGESIQSAAKRRLLEELGFTVPLKAAGAFQYQFQFENALIEHEYDHVLIGFSSIRKIHYNKNEIATVRWVHIADLKKELQAHPKTFTPWFEQALKIALQCFQKNPEYRE